VGLVCAIVVLMFCSSELPSLSCEVDTLQDTCRVLQIVLLDYALLFGADLSA